MIIRTEIEGRMEKYFRYVFFDRELTLKDKGVLLTLLGLPKDLSFSITEVEKHVPEKSTAIRTSLQKLEKKGYIRRWLVRGKKCQICGKQPGNAFPECRQRTGGL